MEITRFVVERRNDALVVGDYGTYRKSLSRRILTLRRRLGRTTAKGRKYTQKAPITAQDIASNEEFIHLQLLIAERAWAHAMYMKSMHSNDSDQAVTGSTRTHILSRLEKARKAANALVESLSHDKSSSGDKVQLEAQAYRSLISGTLFFEARKWTKCLEEYSVTQVVYSSLAKSAGKQAEIFQELLSTTIEPSIRYAAYQSKISRSLPIPQIVSKYLDKNNQAIRTLLKIDPKSLDEQSDPKGSTGDVRTLPKTITWRTRNVPIEDATIAEALANIHEAQIRLAKTLASSQLSSKDKAAAYDDVLVPSQDAVDAAKSAVDELIAEGVPSADKRLQSLQITRTALNYDLIGWRIGRYRVLCGSQDGVSLETAGNKGKPETTSSKTARLRERLVLYDSILQSLESINELPGVAADQALGAELNSKQAYFTALRSIAIARHHSLQGNSKNALALLAGAAKQVALISSTDSDTSNDQILGIEVTREQAESLQKCTQGLVAQHHALVEIQKIQQEETKAETNRKQGETPLIEHLNEYPTGGVDLKNLVDYPPKFRAIPVKPIFLDLAWNHILYPGKTLQASNTAARESAQNQEPPPAQEKKRGWFGFSR